MGAMAEDLPWWRRWRLWSPLLWIFVAPWVVYCGLLMVQPADRFDAWHGEVAWPAAHFLTESQGGILLPVFGHLMFGGVGALFVAMLFIAVARGLGKLMGLGDPSGVVVWVVLVLVPVWSFTTFKAVPQTVTEIDPDARTLTVRQFGALLRVPVGTTRIGGDELLGLELDSYLYRRNGTRYLEMFAWTREGSVKIGERACAWEEETCLGSGDADLVELAAWLGHPGAAVELRDGRHLLRTMR